MRVWGCCNTNAKYLNISVAVFSPEMPERSQRCRVSASVWLVQQRQREMLCPSNLNLFLVKYQVSWRLPLSDTRFHIDL